MLKAPKVLKGLFDVMFKQLFMVPIKRNNIHYGARDVEFL